MRPHQIIAGMSPEEFEQLMRAIREESPEALQSTTIAAAGILKFRPKFLMKQPLPKRIGSIKSAMSRMMANSLAEEILAVYFLRCRKDLLCEWLDTMGLEHEDGILTQEEVPCPETAELETKVGSFRAVDDSPDRELLLKVFSGQAAIDWPALDAMVEAQ